MFQSILKSRYNYRSAVGYVEEIIPQQTYFDKKKQKDFTVYKFLINNDDGIIIQCNVYNNNIKQFESKIQLYEVRRHILVIL